MCAVPCSIHIAGVGALSCGVDFMVVGAFCGCRGGSWGACFVGDGSGCDRGSIGFLIDGGGDSDGSRSNAFCAGDVVDVVSVGCMFGSLNNAFGGRVNPPPFEGV